MTANLWRRMILPAALAVSIIAVAPFMGRLRDALFQRMPTRALELAGLVFAVVLGGAFLGAVISIRERRWLRYGGLVACGLLVWLQIAGFATGIPEVDVVERMHVLEYGLLAVLLYRALLPLGGSSSVVLSFLGGTLIGILDEWVQWLVASRVGEVGDVWLNASATATGLLFGLCLWPAANLVAWPGPRRRAEMAAMTGLTILVFGGFFHCAHLGYEIRDPEEGWVFRSWYSPEELSAVARQRARRWAMGHLPTLEPMDAEDYYFVEGTSHVAHRNESLEHGRVGAAWMEQRILERYYAPVLEQRGLGSGEPLDYAPEQRRDLRRRAEAGGLPSAYRSPVLADRIVVSPSKAEWWLAIGAVVTLFGALTLRWLRASDRHRGGGPGEGRPPSATQTPGRSE